MRAEDFLGEPTESDERPQPITAERFLSGIHRAGDEVDETSTAARVLRRGAIIGARFGGPVLGAVTAGIPGAVAGGLAGETVAQALEKTTGEREALNPKSIALSGALGLVPLKGLAPGTSFLKRAAWRAGQGAAEGTVASGAFALAEDQPITAENLLLGAAAGGVLGTAGAGIERGVERGLAARATKKAAKATVTREGVIKPKETYIRPEDVVDQGELFMRKPGAAAAGPPYFRDPPASRFEQARFKRIFGGALPEEHIEGIADIVEANPHLLAEQGRGVMPDATRDALAGLIAPRPGLKAPVGSTYDAVQIKALGDFYVGARNHTEGLLSQRAANMARGVTDEMLDREIEQAFRVESIGLANYTGGATEIARAMRTLQSWRRIHAGGRDIDLVRRLSRQEGQTRTADEIAAILASATNEEQRMRMILDLSKPNWAERASAYYKASLLGRVVTNTRNTVTALSNFPIAAVSKTFGASRDWAMVRAGLRDERTQWMGEIPMMARGFTTGLPLGFRRALTILRKGFVEGDPLDPLRKIRATRSSELAPGEEALTAGTKLLEPLKYSSRSLAASDDFMRTIGEEMYLHAGAYSRARRAVGRKGLKGREAHQAAMEQMGKYLDDVPADLIDEVATLSSRLTFQEDPGAVVHALYSARSALAKRSKTAALAFDFVIPFVKTPANIIRRGLINTPGLGYKMAGREAERLTEGMSAMASARIGDVISGEAVLGTMALAPLAYLASIGALRGDAPRDPRQRARDYEAGRMPNSLTMANGTTVSLNLFGPAALPAALIANAYQAYEEARREKKPFSLDNVVMDLMKRTGSSVLKQSFLLGLEQIMEAFTDSTTPGGQRFAKMLGQRAGSAIPFSGALQEVRNVMDPTVLDPQGFGEAALQGLPGARSVFGVTPRIETTGELAEKPMVLAPFTDVTETAGPDIVRDELDRLAKLGYEVGWQPAQREQRIKIGRDEYVLDRDASLPVRQAKMRAVTGALRQFMERPSYADIPDHAKAQVIKRVRENATRVVNAKLRGLIARGIQPTAEDLVPEVWD